uniref:Uncharacterized protein n=1 Tax=Arundo donax TaxID=35708 RepID=A0A0A9BUK4_ARUDO
MQHQSKQAQTLKLTIEDIRCRGSRVL